MAESPYFRLTRHGLSSTKELRLYEPKKTLAELASRGVDISIANGLANSLVHRCRGPLPSEAFLLTDRESLEAAAPNLFPETRGKGAENDRVRYGESIGPGWFRVVVAGGDTVPTTTDSYITDEGVPWTSLYYLQIINAHALGSVKKPDGYQSWWDTGGATTTLLEKGKLTDRKSPFWSFRKQIYFIHLADQRYFLGRQEIPGSQKTTIPDTRNPNHGGYDIVPRPFTITDSIAGITEDLNQTNQTDTLFWNPRKFSLDSNGLFWFLNLMSDSSSVSGEAYSDQHISLGTSGGGHSWDPPTSFNNAQALPEGGWKTVWALLDEISHTIVAPMFKGIQVGSFVAMGDDSSSTLNDEREAHKKYLISTSNDGRMVEAPNKYRIHFPVSSPLSLGSMHQTYENRLVRTTNQEKYINVDSSSLGVSHESHELGNYTEDLKGRIVYRKSGGGFFNEAQVNTHAQEIAKLHFKKKLWESRNCFFREEYSGWVFFTASKDLSSIAWVSTGSGPKTIISSTPFDLDRIDPLPIDRLRKNNSITIPNASQKLPDDFFNQVSFSFMNNSVAWGTNVSKLIYSTSTTPDLKTIVGWGNITAVNASGRNIEADLTATIYWCYDTCSWEAFGEANQPSNFSSTENSIIAVVGDSDINGCGGAIAVGDTVNQGTCNKANFVGTSVALTSGSVTARNLTKQTASSGDVVVLVKDYASGLWCIIAHGNN